jgi:hypothetical protein
MHLRGLNKKLFAALIDPTKTIGSLPEVLTGVWRMTRLDGSALDAAGGTTRINR